MKTRQGFVSNSSSSSFIVYGVLCDSKEEMFAKNDAQRMSFVVPTFIIEIGRLFPTPHFGTTLAMTVRSSVALQMSRQPINHFGAVKSRSCSAKATTSVESSREGAKSRTLGKFKTAERKFSTRSLSAAYQKRKNSPLDFILFTDSLGRQCDPLNRDGSSWQNPIQAGARSPAKGKYSVNLTQFE